jgi:hypothetical protein
MSEYFGPDSTDLGTQDGGFGGYPIILGKKYRCPGAGSRTVESIELWCKSNGGTPGNIKLAIYDSSKNLVCRGRRSHGQLYFLGWVRHVGAANILPILRL